MGRWGGGEEGEGEEGRRERGRRKLRADDEKCVFVSNVDNLSLQL